MAYGARAQVLVTVAALGALGLMACMAALFSTDLIFDLLSGSSSGDTGNTGCARRDKSEYGAYKRAAVTTGTHRCSKMAVKVMEEKGGSAVDAAIVASLCECTVNMHHCGIGGGFFATVYDTPKNGTEKELTTVTARERAPAAATQDLFKDKPGASFTGGLAVGVPGQIYGYYEAWKKFGRVEWASLFDDVIEMCEKGFRVERSLAKAIAETTIEDPSLRELITKPDGSLAREGDKIYDKKMAATYRSIANNSMSFYDDQHQLAQDIIADLAANGSIIVAADLSSYATKNVFKDPLSTNLSNGNYTIHYPPPPSSAVVTSFILAVLNGYWFSPKSLEPMSERGLTYHRIVEAMKFAFAKRSQIGDEDFVDVTKLVANLTSPEYASSIRKKKKVPTATLR